MRNRLADACKVWSLYEGFYIVELLNRSKP